MQMLHNGLSKSAVALLAFTEGLPYYTVGEERGQLKLTKRVGAVINATLIITERDVQELRLRGMWGDYYPTPHGFAALASYRGWAGVDRPAKSA